MATLEEHPFTEDEITAIRAVNTELREKLGADAELDLRTVVACTLIYKCRVDRAVESFMDWKEMREEFGVTSIFGDGWDDSGSEVSVEWEKAYSICGRDIAGRTVFWINGGAIEVADEGKVIRAANLFFLALWGDLHTLRNGITMVIDQTKDTKKTGNERKMQQSWQKFPNRPQAIYIAGASFVKRIFINGLLKFAALFSKQKILNRIRFCKMAGVKESIPDASMPTALGGDKHPSVTEWAKDRLANFPVPDLADQKDGAGEAEAEAEALVKAVKKVTI